MQCNINRLTILHDLTVSDDWNFFFDISLFTVPILKAPPLCIMTFMNNVFF